MAESPLPVDEAEWYRFEYVEDGWDLAEERDFKPKDGEAKVWEDKILQRFDDDGFAPDEYLILFVDALRYLRHAFPAEDQLPEFDAHREDVAVPFDVEVAHGSSAVRGHCEESVTTWTGVYNAHPAFTKLTEEKEAEADDDQQAQGEDLAEEEKAEAKDGEAKAEAKAESKVDEPMAEGDEEEEEEEDEDWEPTVVIRGTALFYEGLAAQVLPLGQLAKGGAFQKKEENLMFFLWHLNRIAGPGLIFLHEHDDFQRSAKEVGLALTSGLLGFSSAFADGDPSAELLGQKLGGEVNTRWFKY